MPKVGLATPAGVTLPSSPDSLGSLRRNSLQLLPFAIMSSQVLKTVGKMALLCSSFPAWKGEDSQSLAGSASPAPGSWENAWKVQLMPAQLWRQRHGRMGREFIPLDTSVR